MSHSAKRKIQDLKLSIPSEDNFRFGIYSRAWPLIQQTKKRKISTETTELGVPELNSQNWRTKKKVSFSDDVSVIQ